jgi:hypothetical protein
MVVAVRRPIEREDAAWLVPATWPQTRTDRYGATPMGRGSRRCAAGCAGTRAEAGIIGRPSGLANDDPPRAASQPRVRGEGQQRAQHARRRSTTKPRSGGPPGPEPRPSSTSPNLRDLERSYLVADPGGCRYGALDVLATWCCPARRRRRSRRSIDAQTDITLPTSLGLSGYIFSAPYGVSAGHESFSGDTPT